MWLSLVEYLVWDQGVAGSNPVTPIFYYDRFNAGVLDFTGLEAVFVLPCV